MVGCIDGFYGEWCDKGEYKLMNWISLKGFDIFINLVWLF